MHTTNVHSSENIHSIQIHCIWNPMTIGLLHLNIYSTLGIPSKYRYLLNYISIDY